MADPLGAALEYAAAGLYVFPARVLFDDGHKQVRPVKAWRQASSRDERQIREWFGPDRPWAGASLCVDCGRSAIVVVDLDVSADKDGVLAWSQLDLEQTPLSYTTPGGGLHLWYREHRRHVVGIDSSGKVGHGIDVRGLGGFVIVAPSEDARGAYGPLDVQMLDELPVVPELVIERMSPRREPVEPVEREANRLTADAPRTTPAPASSTGAALTLDQGFTTEQAVAFLRPHWQAFRELRTPQDHGFNAKLNALACMYSHFVPEFWSAAAVERHLIGLAVHNRSVEWQGEDAVLATIRSGLRQQSDPWRAVRVDAPAQVDADGSDWPTEGVEQRYRLGDFAGVRGRERAQPAFMARTDGIAMLYPGKDSYLYAETESGKSWLAALTVRQCIDRGVPVMVVDFEEGDEIEYGTRLLELGATEAALSDPDRFRYVMVDGRCADALVELAGDMAAQLVVIEGMSVAYDVFGWQVKENDSATAFRRTLVKPHLMAGRAVLTTDHVVKDRDTRGRYAIGGVMKLNAASGGAFLLVNYEALSPGAKGASGLYVTKDRPGGVKRHGVSAGDKFDPQVKRMGTLVVDDSREFVNYLDVRICPPDAGGIEVGPTGPSQLGQAILAAVERIEATGRDVNLRSLRGERLGKHAAVDDEIESLLTRGLLIERLGSNRSRLFQCAPVEES